MTEKFTRFKGKFTEMYHDGLTYAEICAELRINVLTALDWRKKLGLPPRRRTGPLSWMDEKRIDGKSPREILGKVAKPLGLSPKDIEFILVRFEKLKSKELHRGRSQIRLILALTYSYLRWESSGRKPISPKNFVLICETNDLRINRQTLLRYERLLKQEGLYPATHLKPHELLERMWSSVKDEFSLPERVKATALELMSQFKFTGRSPEVVAATCLYVAAPRCGAFSLTQRDLADTFGVTEVSIRNAKNTIDSALLGEGQISPSYSQSTNAVERSKEAESFREANSERAIDKAETSSCKDGQPENDATSGAITEEQFQRLREMLKRTSEGSDL